MLDLNWFVCRGVATPECLAALGPPYVSFQFRILKLVQFEIAVFLADGFNGTAVYV